MKIDPEEEPSTSHPSSHTSHFEEKDVVVVDDDDDDEEMRNNNLVLEDEFSPENVHHLFQKAKEYLHYPGLLPLFRRFMHIYAERTTFIWFCLHLMSTLIIGCK